MELNLKPELEARIARLARDTGRDAEDVVEQLLQSFLDYDDWFRHEVRKGIDEADRGELIDHQDLVSLVERRLREKSDG
jgi:RHH-type rel operon transcriptional repressor/antitoxin RelB